METVFSPSKNKVNEANASVEFENAEDMRFTQMLLLSALGKSEDNLRKQQLLLFDWKKGDLMYRSR